MPRRQRLTTVEPLISLDQLDEATLNALGEGEEADHTPIIITDGSVRIDFSADEYSPIGGLFSSSGLNLHMIEATHDVHSDGTGICYFAKQGEVCIAVFHTTTAGGVDEPITIQGGLGTSPAVIFSSGQYPRDNGAPSNRLVYRNATRTLSALEIFSLRGHIRQRVHVCPLVRPGARYKLWDPHEHEHEE